MRSIGIPKRLEVFGFTQRSAYPASGTEWILERHWDEYIQIRQNNEETSGKDVLHLHFHMIPKFQGDDFENSAYEIISFQERTS